MACVSPRLREIRARAPDIIAPIADDPNAAEVVKISEGQLYLVRSGAVRGGRECMSVRPLSLCTLYMKPSY